MTRVDRWLLPDGVEEVLPAEAARVEQLRRQLLDLYRSWGYQLVIPPLMEFTESLLIGLGSDIELMTFKITDQLSGRSMGIRADITPQAARIDAHSLAAQGVNRLCYAGSVLHTRRKSLMASRCPIQLGAELYGDSSLEADCEVIRLMLATLTSTGLDHVTLDLGHVGIYRALLADANLDEEDERQLFDTLQRKSLPDLEQAATVIVDDVLRELVCELTKLHGDATVLDLARSLFKDYPGALAAVEELQAIAEAVEAQCPGVGIYFDLGELRGYHYHTGIVFAAYVPGHGRALANGGRYDDVGAVFGRARPATGFNTDLKALMSLLPESTVAAFAVAAPVSADAALALKVNELRAAGEVVICTLSGEVDTRCNRQLLLRDNEWVVATL